MTYEETRPWAKSIRERVITRKMPPWHLDKTVGIQQFQNDRSLSDEQIATIVRWVDSGAPLGDPKDMPPPKQWPDDDGWQLAKQFGPPDLVIKSDPTRCRRTGRTCGSSRSPKFPSPSRAGCARSKCVPARRPAAGSRTTSSRACCRRNPMRP